jgi:hypothetical protein
MATTKDRLEELPGVGTGARRVLDRAALDGSPAPPTMPAEPASAPAPPRPSWRWLLGSISGGWALGAAVAWIVLLNVGIRVMPTRSPEELAAATPLWASILDWASLALLVVALAGFAMRRRFGLAASLGSALILTSFTVACPITNHHETVGLWWSVQLACFATLAVLSVVGLRRAAASA